MPPNEQTATEKDPVFEQRGFAVDPPEEGAGLSAEEADRIAAGMQGGSAGEEGGDTTPPAEGQAAAAPAKPKVRIGTREFDNDEAAWAYAQELEQEKIAADAFRHGVETASQAQQVTRTEAPPEPLVIDQEFYTNPAEYFRKRDAKVAAEVEARVNGNLSLKERNAKTWTDFYTDYPDLAKAQPLVQIALNQDWDQLKHVETKKALKIVAERARAMRKEMLDDAAPGTELPRVTQGASSGKGTAPQGAPAGKEQDLNFTQQMRSLRKNKTARMRR